MEFGIVRLLYWCLTKVNLSANAFIQSWANFVSNRVLQIPSSTFRPLKDLGFFFPLLSVCSWKKWSGGSYILIGKSFIEQILIFCYFNEFLAGSHSILKNLKNMQNQELLHSCDWPEGDIRSPQGTTSVHWIQHIPLASRCFVLVFRTEWKHR